MHKIGIISDTHNLLRTPVTDMLASCNAILHAGDISSPHILGQLQAIAPGYAVRGNTDREWAAALPAFLSMELFGIRICLIHDKKMIPESIQDRDLIIYGHSHKYEHLSKNGQTWLNPGSCGKKRFALPVTMAVLTIDAAVPEPVSGSTIKTPGFQIEKITFQETGKPAWQDSSTGMPPLSEMKQIVKKVMRETDRGTPVERIAAKCRIREELAAQICRLYLTHPGVTPDGILGKMGL